MTRYGGSIRMVWPHAVDPKYALQTRQRLMRRGQISFSEVMPLTNGE